MAAADGHAGAQQLCRLDGEVGQNAVGARALAREGGLDGVGVPRAARLAQRGDVVDVHMEGDAHGSGVPSRR